MNHGTRLTLVIPTLNEAENIRPLLERVSDTLSRTPCHWDIIVVDDCSEDGTGEIVEEFARTNSRVRLMVRPKERGLAGAISHGWSCTDADLLGVIDADLQHPPEVLVSLLERIDEGADIAIASRYVLPGSMDGWNPTRKLLSRLSVLASLPVQKPKVKVNDPLSGFFVVRRECITGLSFQKTGFKLLLEILSTGRINKAVEAPFRFALREHGHSKATLMTGVHYASLLFKLFIYKMNSLKDALTPSTPTVASTSIRHHLRLPFDILLGLSPLLLGAELLLWLIVAPAAARGHADFRQLYAAGYMLRTGQAHQLYDYETQLRVQNQIVSAEQAPLPFLRPAYSALFFAPLSYLSYRHAYFAFMAINIILTALSCWWLMPLLPNLVERWALLPILLFAAFYPISAAIIQGQDSILYLFLTVLSLALWTRGRSFSSGILLGLAFFKFQILLPLLLMYLVLRKRKVVAGSAISATICVLVSVALVGWEGSLSYARSLLSLTTSSSASFKVASFPVRMSFMPNLHGLCLGVLGTSLDLHWVTLITVVLSVWLLCVTALQCRQRGTSWIVATGLTAAVLVSYYLFIHDFAILLVPIALTLNVVAASSPPELLTRARWIGCTVVLTFILPVFDPFLSNYRYLMALPVLFLWSYLVADKGFARASLSGFPS